VLVKKRRQFFVSLKVYFFRCGFDVLIKEITKEKIPLKNGTVLKDYSC